MGDWRAVVRTAADTLRAGGIGAFPTETVYGLGARAADARAVARVFEVKRRPTFDPLIVHVGDESGAMALAAEWPESAHRLTRAFWPGPLTVVVPKRPDVPDIVTAGLPTVALRCPRHPVAAELLRALGEPIAAPSANPFGRTSPTAAEHVRETLGSEVDFVLDAGPCTVGIESTIVSLVAARPALLRPGGVPAEEIEAVVGPLDRPREVSPDRPESPGRLPRHYAPRTPLRLVPAGATARPGSGRWGLLVFQRLPEVGGWERVEVLSRVGDLREAAANLFAAIRRLDEANLDGIAAELVPDSGLGLAINDRLRRAAHPGPVE
ncbi:MAG: L-threonylcarbamoyladenylate synthase [Kiritimatiellae bacterium]|nr:L-threonylcarbamoyladenylate synthase [Kiritimatiellia bacterium]